MDEEEIGTHAKGIKKVEKRLDSNVKEMCKLLQTLAERIFKNQLSKQDEDLLREHFHDTYKSLVFHSGDDSSSFDAPTKLRELGLSIGLNPEELDRQPDENSALDYCADPGSKLMEIGKTKRKRENGQAKTKCFGQEADDISSNLEFPSYSQDELMKIYGERTQRKAMLTFDSKELESSEEEEGISEEELEKTKGWKLLVKALDSKFEKKDPANP